MLPPGAGRLGPAGRTVHLRLGGLPWGTVPRPPGPAMARPQRTPARSPDSIVEVKSKVRVSLVSALATALGAPNSLSLLLVPRVSITSFCPPPFTCYSAFLSASSSLRLRTSRVPLWPGYVESKGKTLDSVPCTGAEV